VSVGKPKDNTKLWQLWMAGRLFAILFLYFAPWITSQGGSGGVVDFAIGFNGEHVRLSLKILKGWVTNRGCC
jgi:hypothetical protein